MTAAARAASDTAAPLSVVVVISRYPPHHVGGYELRCRDVSRELARRGHRVTVLTSREGARGVEDDGGVRVVRGLHHWPDGVTGAGGVARFVLATAADCRRLRAETRRGRADVVAYWHQSGLSSALLAVRPRAGCGVLCDVSSDWLLDTATNGGNWFRIWERRSATRWKKAGKAALRAAAAVLGAPVRRPPFPPGRTYFTSAETKRRYLLADVAVETGAVIRSGIELDRFPFRGDRPDGRRTVLFLSRIKRWKGLHTAVLALARLPTDVVLRAVGHIEDGAYLTEVGELARASGVLGRIQFGDPVPHHEVASLLHSSHALVFGSEEPEPFSRLVLEAFACGTPVVGTTLGGTGEVLVEGETGLTFPPGNARALADQLSRLLGDAALRDRLVANARKLVETRYSLGFTVDQIEALLREARAAGEAPPA